MFQDASFDGVRLLGRQGYIKLVEVEEVENKGWLIWDFCHMPLATTSQS